MATKVKLTYVPEGGSKREWTVDLENPAWDIAYVTETETGWPWKEFGEKLGNASHIALRAMIFALRKRDEPRLQIESVTPSLDEIDLELIEDPALPDAYVEGESDPEA